jgi:rhamnosyltransferase
LTDAQDQAQVARARLVMAVLVPTLNAGNAWADWIRALQTQTLQPRRVLVLDSASSDDTAAQALNRGFEVMAIDPATFNHGETRQLGVQTLQDVDVLVCMTQDAVLADSQALERLVAAFDDDRVAAAFGRQLAAKDATPIAAHARSFNYPDTTRTTSLADRARLGFKACFISNSFAAYRMRDLMMAGGFPRHVILGEDTAVASRLLLAGKSVVYAADALVYHSHNYSPLEDFRRYFDTGVFHARERWLLDAFGGASGEGLRFVKSELRYLLKNAPWLIPSALLRTVLKLLGYRLGRAEERLPLALKRRLSMFRGFWANGSHQPEHTKQF